jgi:heme/copper-type cytochrome/quinol oxidase subunit 2
VCVCEGMKRSGIELISMTLFPDPQGPIAILIQELHSLVMNVAIFILVFVLWMMLMAWYDFSQIATSKPFVKEALTLRNTIFLYGKAHAPSLEIIWTLIPTLVLLLIALPSFTILYVIEDFTVPVIEENQQFAYVKAIGKQWFWQYDYTFMGDEKGSSTASYMVDSNMLYETELWEGDRRLLQTDQALVLDSSIPTVLLVTSMDVLHSFSVPSLGLKVDACPGRLNQVPFAVDPNFVGTLYGQCSELCGVNHGFMPIRIIFYHGSDL